MFKANGKLIVRWPEKYPDATDLHEESVHVFPFSRWLSHLILVLVSLAAIVLTALFFSAFLALFLITAFFSTIWIWLFCRKLRKSAGPDCLDGENFLIEETRMFEKEVGKERNKQTA